LPWRAEEKSSSSDRPGNLSPAKSATMKNNQLKKMMAERLAGAAAAHEAAILNHDELMAVTGGKETPVECPKLQSCTTFSNCNGKCGVNGIVIEPHL
jgi:hypothetical protein